MHRRIAWKSLGLTVALALAAGQAQAFSLFPDFGGNPSSALSAAARWANGFGLEDRIQVGVQPGLIEAFALVPPTAQELADYQAGIVSAFGAWENPALQFDISFDAATTVDNQTGFEIDIIGLAGSDPIFSGTQFAGLANPDYFFTQRTLTNGTVANGYVITGADIYLNVDLMKSFGQILMLSPQDALNAFIRLMMHEVGHAIGLGHPDQAINYDTDFDPLNAMLIDPSNPFAGFVQSANFDGQAIMVPRPCGGNSVFCAATTFTQLRNDDLAGRDVLYPVPEPGIVPLVALAAVSIARVHRRGSRARRP